MSPPTSELDSDTEPGVWHRRFWGDTDRAGIGCGCFYLIAILLVVTLVLSLFVDALRLY